MKIRTGDTVVVISGKDKGKTGQVLRTLHTKNRVVVTDVNIRTRHMKAGPNRPGEIIKYEAALDASNVMIIDATTKKRSRIGYKIEKNKKTRIARQSGAEIKKAAVATKKKATEKTEKDVTTTKKTTKTTKKTSSTKESTVSSTSPKSPFWKKMGFGAEEMGAAGADIEVGSHMKEDHSVADQIERSSGRGSQRGK